MKFITSNVSLDILNVLRCLVEKFEITDTKFRSLELLKTKTGFQKWYSQHYGFALNRDLFVVKRAREFHGERAIADAIASAGISKNQVVVCGLDGIREINFDKAFFDLPCAPVLLVSSSICEKGYVLSITEESEYWFSTNLWQKLSFKTKWWIDP